MLHQVHRFCAIVIGVFALFHLANHLAAFGGVATHIEFMQRLRSVYRWPLAEAVLLACVAYQAGSGLYFVARRRGQRRGLFDRLQAFSGAYLAFFLLVHVASVLFGRLQLGLDTNFYFAAAGLHIAPYQAFFVPYYTLAVLALAAHVACAFHYLARARFGERARDRIGLAGVAGGAVLALAIVATFSGAFYPIAVPPEYRATFQ